MALLLSLRYGAPLLLPKVARCGLLPRQWRLYGGAAAARCGLWGTATAMATRRRCCRPTNQALWALPP